ncbi:MAG TPA: DUF397 domain-containing protein [Actinophytocola sp.]|jgi:hypothetical protein|uniref:DUF397 domain-containing protein n=1 Tax=Actinophytocola sp. TaxID=1872138 RepID=UPI002E0065B0|nr:DUF397 domain-containing protein [Actinophytocola sp.]
MTTWRKSSRSTSQANCVEIAHPTTTQQVAVRDSKNPVGPTLTFPTPTWTRFLRRP